MQTKGLLIRMDDITSDMNWDNFEKLIAIFDQYDIKPLLGIVPDNRDSQLHMQEPREDFAARMLELQNKGYYLAQHGYQHVYETENGGLLNVHKTSEFAGLSFEVQIQKLLHGKEILEQQGIITNIFMAPGHAYDTTTLKALHQTRFEFVTDGYGCTPYTDYNLQFIPCTLSAVRKREGIDTVCIHANTMSEADIEKLKQSIAENRDIFLTWKQVLEMPKPAKNHKIKAQEKRELTERSRKAFAGSNDIVQAYMQRTYASNKALKLVKRVIGLPGLGIRLLGARCKKS